MNTKAPKTTDNQTFWHSQKPLLPKDKPNKTIITSFATLGFPIQSNFYTRVYKTKHPANKPNQILLTIFHFQHNQKHQLQVRLQTHKQHTIKDLTTTNLKQIHKTDNIASTMLHWFILPPLFVLKKKRDKVKKN